MTEKNLDNMPAVALDYIANGHKAAIATVIETWGSAPRPVGAQLAIRDDGTFQGSVSGGCVEGAVVAEAIEVLQTGECRVLEYGVPCPPCLPSASPVAGKSKSSLNPLV